MLKLKLKFIKFFEAVSERKVVVKYLGNDHASHKSWMKRNLLDLLNLNKQNKGKKLVEAKLYAASPSCRKVSL
jgi:hypothetical protein